MDDMAGTKKAGSRARFPWFRVGFDIEGIAGALAAYLIGLLLGLVWGPLFWLGVAGVVVILLATRSAVRTPPDSLEAVVAPCDGVVVSIEDVEPPLELRLDADRSTQIRISSSPASANMILAPIEGVLKTLVTESGDPARILNVSPEGSGQAAAFATIEGEAGAVGLRTSAGGLGPRLHLVTELGDTARLGRKIGVRRLGGWTDVFLPLGADVAVQEGQSLIGGETIICQALAEARAQAGPHPSVAEVIEVAHEPEVQSSPDDEPEASPPEPETEIEPETGSENASSTSGDDETDAATARLFEKLKREAAKASDD